MNPVDLSYLPYWILKHILKIYFDSLSDGSKTSLCIVRILVSLKNPEILGNIFFILIPGVGYGTASGCPQQLTMIFLVL